MTYRQNQRTFWTAAVIGLLAAILHFDRPASIGGMAGNMSWLGITAAIAGCLAARFGPANRGKTGRFVFSIGVMSVLVVVAFTQPFSIAANALFAAGLPLLFLCSERATWFEPDVESRTTQFGGVPFDARPEWELHREIHRARHYNRPLSLVVLSPDESRRRARAAVSTENGQTGRVDVLHLGELMAGQIKAFDILTYQDGLIVHVLPETVPEIAERVASRLTSVAQKRFGVALNVGIAGFPMEEVTLTGLWELARKRLNETETAKRDAARTDVDPLVGNPSRGGLEQSA